MTKPDTFFGLSAIEYYLAGATPVKEPRSQRGYLRVQEYVVRPESSRTIEEIRQQRASHPIAPSMFGYVFGLYGYLAFTMEEINDQGYLLALPKVRGVYNDEQTLVTPLPHDQRIAQRLTKFFQDSNDYSDHLKRLITLKGGFQMV